MLLWDVGSRLGCRGLAFGRGGASPRLASSRAYSYSQRKEHRTLICMTNLTPTGLLIVALVVIPVAIVFERAEPRTWQERLAMAHFQTEPNRHTPLHAQGTFLPPVIPPHLTLTAHDNPVILAGRSEVPRGHSLTLEPGVTVFAHEFAELKVFGQLTVNGTSPSPVTLTSNERHPQNQIWNGVIVAEGGTATLTHIRFHFASPALTCLPGSNAHLSNSEIRNALIGIFTNSPNCHSVSNRIEAIRDPIVSTFQIPSSNF